MRAQETSVEKSRNCSENLGKDEVLQLNPEFDAEPPGSEAKKKKKSSFIVDDYRVINLE